MATNSEFVDQFNKLTYDYIRHISQLEMQHYVKVDRLILNRFFDSPFCTERLMYSGILLEGRNGTQSPFCGNMECH